MHETLKTQNRLQGGLLCTFGSHTFVPTSWMCKRQTSVPHSSTEAEIISLDAGLRMDGIPALDLWDLVIEVFHASHTNSNNTKGQVDTTSNKHTRNKTKVLPTQHCNFDLNNVDCAVEREVFSIWCDAVHLSKKKKKP